MANNTNKTKLLDGLVYSKEKIPINFCENTNRELFMTYLDQVFKNSSFTENDAYHFFSNIHPNIHSGVLRTDVINGSILFLKSKSINNIEIELYDKSDKLLFFIENNDATFISKYVTIFIRDFNNPISSISIRSKKILNIDDEIPYTNLSYNQCYFVIDTLMKYIATLLTWQYKKTVIDKH